MKKVSQSNQSVMQQSEGEWNKRSMGKSVRLWSLLLVIVMAAVVLGGCGSSSDNSAANRGSSEPMGNSSLKAKMDASYNSVTTTSNSEESSDSDRNAAAPASQEMTTDSKEREMPQADSPPSNSPTAGSGAAEFGAFDRKLIYNANVTLEVENYGDAQTELFNMVSLSGGYMLNFNDTQTKYELGGIFVIKVPSQGFHPFVNKLEGLKKKNTIPQRSIRGQDVTEEYVDISSRMKAKQVVESRLLNFMEEATDTKNLLQFSNELARVQEEIETIKGRMRYIDQNVAFSTVELRMYERLGEVKPEDEEEKKNAIERAGSAMKASGKAILSMLEGLLIVIAGALPILVLVAVIGIPLWVIYSKTRYRGPGTSNRQYAAPIDNDTITKTEQAENASTTKQEPDEPNS